MNKIAKAIVAGVTALGGATVTAMSDGAVTTIEYVLIFVATVTATAAVWATTNAPADKS